MVAAALDALHLGTAFLEDHGDLFHGAEIRRGYGVIEFNARRSFEKPEQNASSVVEGITECAQRLRELRIRRVNQGIPRQYPAPASFPRDTRVGSSAEPKLWVSALSNSDERRRKIGTDHLFLVVGEDLSPMPGAASGIKHGSSYVLSPGPDHSLVSGGEKGNLAKFDRVFGCPRVIGLAYQRREMR